MPIRLVNRWSIPPALVADRSTLQIGIDEPNSTNAGVYSTDLIPRATVVGNVTLSTAGQVYENKTVQGKITVTAANVTIRNVAVIGQSTTTGDMISCTAAGVSNLLIEDCTIEPAFPLKASGVVGHDFTLRRCIVSKTLDGVNVFNTSAVRPYQTNVVIEQNWICERAWWTAATTGIIHPSDTESHNDDSQHQGGGGTIYRGNRFGGSYARQWAHWYVTNPLVEPFTTVTLGSLSDGGPYQAIPNRGSGTDATGRYNYDDIACLQIGDEVGYSFNLVVEDNWFYGGNFAINGGGNTNPGGGVILGSFKRNRFARNQGNQGSGGNTTQTINFQGGGWSGFYTAPTTGADKNYYMDDGAAVTVRS